MTPTTQRLSFSKENIRNVKHNDMFTHPSVIQIFRLRVRPDVHQIPSNPRGMVWPNLPQSMWPRLESRGKRRNVCLPLCVLCISSFQMWTMSNAAAFEMTQATHHLEDRLSREIFSRGKLRHYFFIQSSAGSSCIYYITLHYSPWGGDTNHINPRCVYNDIIMTAEFRSPVHYVLWYNNTVSVHINMKGMDWDLITRTSEALNCAIILSQHTAGPVVLDLKGSWASPQWLPLNKSVLDRCQATFLYIVQWRQCADLMTAWSPDLRGIPVGKMM